MRDNKAVKVPILSLYIIPKHPSVANHLFFKGYPYMWPEKKSNSLWREGRKEGQENKRRKRKRSLICTTNASAAHSLQAEVLYPRYSRGKRRKNKKQLHFFLSTVSSPHHRASPAQGKVAALSPADSELMLCPGKAKVKCCKRTRTAQGGCGGGNAKATSPPATDSTGYGAALTLTGLKDAPKRAVENPGDHKMRNACGVRDTKKNKGSILKQMYKENSVSPHVRIQFLEFSQCQTH